MMVASIQVSGLLQMLIDSRLDTIDRMLLGRLPRSERLEIVREVESQIFELLQERDSGELTREDILAVLARLDPPEAYLPEKMGSHLPETSWRTNSSRQTIRPMRERDPRTDKASGILGLVTLGMVLLIPVGFLLEMVFNSELPTILLWSGVAGCMFIGGIVALALGIYSRMSGGWAIIGIVTSAFSILISCVGGVWLMLALLSQ
jgi:hypothetical protein